jgi:hypothetical protein
MTHLDMEWWSGRGVKPFSKVRIMVISDNDDVNMITVDYLTIDMVIS